jgi:hypothetical protein
MTMFCTNLRTKVRTLLRQFDSYIDQHIDTALKISEALRSLLTSPAANILTAIIPGELDDAIKQELTTALDKVIGALSIADTCKQYTNINEKLACFVQQLQLRDPDLQDAILQKLASLVAATLDGQRLKQSLYDLYTQAKYSASKTA